ncbi:MAG TPA: FAD-dependent oxidoreductase [Candidatus Methylacidiphilales bacterium]|nr:FAD-dependent oxidoreductase [Candidatus Methylacidiphilales bacterium]
MRPLAADLVVYGGTSGGVVAAVQGANEHLNVVLVSPEKHLGGLTSSGLGWADVGNVATIGGLAKDFFHRVWLHYEEPASWLDGTVPTHVPAQTKVGKDNAGQLMYVFEPHVAEAIFDEMIAEKKIEVVTGRLDLHGGVVKEGARVHSLRLEDGTTISGKMFIDATYEGDLMAQAGVSYTVGRESASQYGEGLNGVRVKMAKLNQLPPGIDPYVKKGDPGSGLLPGVNPPSSEPDGSGDKKIQAYCYRMCLTDDPQNRVAVTKPLDYREADYELLFRAIEAGQKGAFFKLSPVPNHKTDSNNDGGISTDFIGMNDDYPDEGYEKREAIARAHANWQLGLVWTLQNSLRVPEAIRRQYAKWGLPKDEFTDNGHWPYALYVREGRRMVGDYVLTEKILTSAGPVARPVAVGSYNMDSHNVQRLVGPDGFVHNEGDVQKPVKHAYGIDYGVLLPKRAEVENLLVPFCISSSHIAFGSIRMESVFMSLGQASASAAAIALKENLAVQDVPYPELKAKLEADGQVLTPPAGTR